MESAAQVTPFPSELKKQRDQNAAARTTFENQMIDGMNNVLDRLSVLTETNNRLSVQRDNAVNGMHTEKNQNYLLRLQNESLRKSGRNCDMMTHLMRAAILGSGTPQEMLDALMQDLHRTNDSLQTKQHYITTLEHLCQEKDGVIMAKDQQIIQQNKVIEELSRKVEMTTTTVQAEQVAMTGITAQTEEQGASQFAVPQLLKVKRGRENDGNKEQKKKMRSA